MALVTNGPTADVTTVYPLPMLLDSSIDAEYIRVQTTAAVTSAYMHVGIYALDYKEKRLRRLPSARVRVDCSTIAVQTLRMLDLVTLLPNVQYYVGVLPSTGVNLVTVNLLTHAFTKAGSAANGLAPVLPVDVGYTNSWLTLPYVQVLSSQGARVV